MNIMIKYQTRKIITDFSYKRNSNNASSITTTVRLTNEIAS